MKVTFMIGNGFDLNCGLKSRFKDVYKEYCSTDSKSEVIKKFKNDIDRDIDTWGDFEMSMAKYIKEFETESDFLDCVHDFTRFISYYLKKEEKRFSTILQSKNNNDLIYKELENECKSSLSSFYKFGSINVVREIDNLQNGFKQHHFISFNYTNFLDDLLIKCANIVTEESKRNYDYPIDAFYTKRILHIHGTTNDHLVLGVNDVGQFEEAKFDFGKKTQRAFVKPVSNANYDKNRISSALYTIQESDVICVFGMSLGESDKMWKDALKEWIKSSVQHYLFIFDYNCSFKTGLLFDESTNEEDDIREIYYEKLNIDSNYANQIYIPMGHNIFNFNRIFDKAFKSDQKEEKPDLHEMIKKKKEELSAV